MSNRRHIAALLVAAFGVFAAVAASAQDLANRSIRIVVPYSAGASTDLTIRQIAQKVTQVGGPTIIIENRPGSGGVAAAISVKQANPDGLTLFLCDLGTFAVNPNLMANLAYDPITDFRPITSLWAFSSVMPVPAALPVSTVAELVELAKRTPGGLSYASQGPGSGGHLMGEMFKRASQAPFVHVPYRGGAPAITDLVAGRVAFLLGTYASLQPYVEANQLKVIAVASGKRMSVLPEVPTLAEAGYPGIDLDVWFGLAAPAGTPDRTIEALNEMFVRAVKARDLEAKITEQGMYVTTSDPKGLTDTIAKDRARLAPIVEAAGLTAN